MTSIQGSIWRKWDLHFHTPSSYDYQNKSVTNQDLIDKLVANNIEVVAITDHHTIDVARIQELQSLGKDQITILPGIEFRSELGGSETVHYIGIFPEDCDLTDVWTKLSGTREITASDIASKGDENIYCDLADTAKIVHKLGGLITVHAGSKSNSIESLKSAKLINRKIKSDLIFESIDILEMGKIKDLDDYASIIFPALKYELPLITCSDNHDIANYPDDGFTWIKGNPSFETLRQSLYEPHSRVLVAKFKPIDPLRRISQVKLTFPDDSKIATEGSISDFCFRGREYAIHFSPNLTCIIGGRGSGKSTLLNLLHEKIYPTKNTFFDDNKLSDSQGPISITDYVNIDEGEEDLQIEFLQQNQIEQFAADPEKLTEATYGRLLKIDTERAILNAEDKATEYSASLERIIGLHNKRKDTSKHIHSLSKSLATNKRIVASLANEDYNALTKGLKSLSAVNDEIFRAYNRFKEYTKALRSLRSTEGDLPFPSTFDELSQELAAEVISSVEKYEQDSRANSEKSKFHANKPLIEAKKKAIEEYLKDKGLTQESLNDATNATEQVETLSNEIGFYESELENIESGISEFTENTSIADDYNGTVTTLLDPINKILSELGSHVKPIRLEYAFDQTSMIADIHDYLLEIYVSEYDGQRRLESIKKAFEGLDFNVLPDQVEFLGLIDTNNKPGLSLHTFFTDTDNYKIFLFEVKRKLSDIVKYKTINVFYDNKPIAATSFGQRCTTAIVILILLGNTPIIIDEPEAHLDSLLIAKYLVGILKTKKLERQIIFASHNANFVINGDSELIHILDMGEDGRTCITSSTIENLEHRDRLLGLEGGKEAFKLRETRYGI